MGMVVALHGAALLLIIKGLAVSPNILAMPEDIRAEILTDPQAPEDVPKLPPVEIRNDVVQMPIPDPVPIPSDDPPGDTIQGQVLPPDGVDFGHGTADPEPVNMVNVRADPHRPLSQPPYPASMIRSGTEGSVDVEVLVQPDGRVGDARIARSSGYDLFDRATLEEARRNWRLLAATRNGEPYAQWYRLRVVFKLKNPQ